MAEAVSLTLDDKLRKAITRVFDAAEQNYDRDQGLPPEDPEAAEALEIVYRLTEHFLVDPVYDK
jgi:hypothetical protein